GTAAVVENAKRPAVAAALGNENVLAIEQPATPVTDAATGDDVRRYLMDLLVDLTGYSPEIIDFDADLEAELGVDSIKKAQLIGELVQWRNLDVTIQDIQLSDYTSLADIAGLAGDIVTGGSHNTPIPSYDLAHHQPTNPTTDPVPAAADSNAAATTAAQANDGIDPALLQQMMIDLLVDQTGYDPEIIDMDADLEAELGVDSIKRAQLIGELEVQFQLPDMRGENLQLADFPTLRSIHTFVMEISGSMPSQPEASPVAIVASTTLDEKKNTPLIAESSAEVLPVPAAGTHRFIPHVVDRSRPDAVNETPIFSGSVILLGQNSVADALAQWWHENAEITDGHVLHHLPTMDSQSVEEHLDRIFSSGTPLHLFLTSPNDAGSMWSVFDSDGFAARHESGMMVPYRVCQRWMAAIADSGQQDHASMVTMLNAGGNFAFSAQSDQLAETSIANGDSPRRARRSNESGAMAGLTKAMRIEGWMRGMTKTPMLVLDGLPGDDQTVDAKQYVHGAMRELACLMHDLEVAVSGTKRRVFSVQHQPLQEIKNVHLTLSHPSNDPLSWSQGGAGTRYPITPGGDWIVAGGGRGITALCAMHLAQRHGLRLHLLGMAPSPDITDDVRQAAQLDRDQLRRDTMLRVQREGGNAFKYWRHFEKAIEIDQTLRLCQQHGIDATYHSVNISDVGAVQQLINVIRSQYGPIRGVIQGAGSGQDARFDRKRPEKVRQCLSAKIDGTVALARATRHDPLEWFVGFGSISGRFGANGHTDYSAANDALSKLLQDLGQERPETRCLTFHWHAWGDIGMATKPEAKLALDMIGMQFMPAIDGLRHFLTEMEQGGDHSNVLVTDRRYIRKFIPHGESPRQAHAAPLLLPEGLMQNDLNASMVPSGDVTPVPAERIAAVPDVAKGLAMRLDPIADPFLAEHRVNDRPTMPLVVAIEALAQAERLRRIGSGDSSEMEITEMRRVMALQALKSHGDDPFAVELHGRSLAELSSDNETHRWTLACDLRRRDGRIVQSARPHFEIDFPRLNFGRGVNSNAYANDARNGWWHDLPVQWLTGDFATVEYRDTDAPVYHGPPLRCLQSFDLKSAASDSQLPTSYGIGRIVTPSAVDLFGDHRPVNGWITCPAVMDAVLYACGATIGRLTNRPSLPVC
ncbi:MAG: SDR family NAD(P)-dependent oxidoreductase, partial [Planctomycetota bacterium]